MVRLKSLECVVCHQAADYMELCTDCGQITCGNCWDSLWCPVTTQYCKRVQFCIPPRLDSLLNAPEDELKENDGQCCSTIGQETSQQELGENTIQDASSSTKGERNVQQQDGRASSKETEAVKTSVARLEECAWNGSYNLRPSAKEVERTEGIPTTIRCIDCKVDEDISKTLNCHTCEKYGICGFCVTQKHWGHKIANTEREMLRGSFQSKSDETFSKMVRWKEDVDNIQRQGASAQTKLCESYRQLFATAVQCGDADLLQSINREGNVNQLHRSVKDYITYGIRLKSSVQNLDDKLAMLLNEAKERNGAMLQGDEQASEGQ